MQSGVSTPAETGGPVVTASGRQVRSRVGGAYGETMLTGRRADTDRENDGEGQDVPNGTSRRTRTSGSSDGPAHPHNHIEGYNSIDEMDDEPDAASSGDDYDAADGGDNFGDDEEMSDEQAMDEEDMDIRPSLVVQLKYGKGEQITKREPHPSPPVGIKSDAVTEEKPLPASPTVPQAPLESQPPPLAPNGSAVESVTKAQQPLGPANTDTYGKDSDQSVAEQYTKPAAPTNPPPMQQTPITQPDAEHDDSGML